MINWQKIKLLMMNLEDDKFGDLDTDLAPAILFHYPQILNDLNDSVQNENTQNYQQSIALFNM